MGDPPPRIDAKGPDPERPCGSCTHTPPGPPKRTSRNTFDPFDIDTESDPHGPKVLASAAAVPCPCSCRSFSQGSFPNFPRGVSDPGRLRSRPLPSPSLSGPRSSLPSLLLPLLFPPSPFPNPGPPWPSPAPSPPSLLSYLQIPVREQMPLTPEDRCLFHMARVTKCIYTCVTKCFYLVCNGARFARLLLLASLARFFFNRLS